PYAPAGANTAEPSHISRRNFISSDNCYDQSAYALARRHVPQSRDIFRLTLTPGAAHMCGIVAYIGRKIAQPLLIEGLKRLEYRGYDSAGIAVIDDKGQMHIRRAVGRISVLEGSVNQSNQLPPAKLG